MANTEAGSTSMDEIEEFSLPSETEEFIHIIDEIRRLDQHLLMHPEDENAINEREALRESYNAVVLNIEDNLPAISETIETLRADMHLLVEKDRMGFAANRVSAGLLLKAVADSANDNGDTDTAARYYESAITELSGAERIYRMAHEEELDELWINFWLRLKEHLKSMDDDLFELITTALNSSNTYELRQFIDHVTRILEDYFSSGAANSDHCVEQISNLYSETEDSVLQKLALTFKNFFRAKFSYPEGITEIRSFYQLLDDHFNRNDLGRPLEESESGIDDKYWLYRWEPLDALSDALAEYYNIEDYENIGGLEVVEEAIESNKQFLNAYRKSADGHKHLANLHLILADYALWKEVGEDGNVFDISMPVHTYITSMFENAQLNALRCVQFESTHAGVEKPNYTFYSEVAIEYVLYLFRRGEETEARHLCKEIIERVPESAEVRIIFARHMFANQWDSCPAARDFMKDLLAQALEIEPDNIEAHYIFGLMAISTGDTKTFLAQINLLEKLDPDDKDGLRSSLMAENLRACGMGYNGEPN